MGQADETSSKSRFYRVSIHALIALGLIASGTQKFIEFNGFCVIPNNTQRKGYNGVAYLNESNTFLARITPVLLTFNEAPNIGRVLDKLTWASEVLVVDSGSDDETLEILRRYINVRCVYRRFDSHAAQWNFAISEAGVLTDWVLALDADYVLTDQLLSEIAVLDPDVGYVGFRTRFRYCVAGKPLRGALYPAVTTLFVRLKGRYAQVGHTQRITLDGIVTSLNGFIDHDDRKPLARWLWAQDRYSALEAEWLLDKPLSELRIQDRLRRMLLITPWLVPLYCLTVKRGAFDGWAGLYYALQRGVAEAVLALKLIEHRHVRSGK